MCEGRNFMPGGAAHEQLHSNDTIEREREKARCMTSRRYCSRRWYCIPRVYFVCVVSPRAAPFVACYQNLVANDKADSTQNGRRREDLVALRQKWCKVTRGGWKGRTPSGSTALVSRRFAPSLFRRNLSIHTECAAGCARKNNSRNCQTLERGRFDREWEEKGRPCHLVPKNGTK